MTLRRPATVHVCGLRHVPEMAARTGARYLVSAIDAALQPPTPGSIPPHLHLKLDMHDIVEEQVGQTPPAAEHVRRLIEFVHDWDGRGPLLVHCFAGISRSTAAAFTTLCALNPETPEEHIALAIRRSSDTALPNRRFVTFADQALRREGRMIAAVAKMGQHRAAYECVPFQIEGIDDGKAGASRAA